MSSITNPTPTSLGNTMWVLGPPTSATELLIWALEKVVSKLPFWTTLWHDIQVNNVMNNPPSAVVFNNVLYYFYSGPSDSTSVFYQTFDGTTWSSAQYIEKAEQASGIGAIVFNNVLYAFYQNVAPGSLGPDTSGGLVFCAVLDSGTWIPNCWATADPSVGISHAPAVMSETPEPAVFNGTLYVFYQGPGVNGELWYQTSTDAVNWSQSIQVSNVGMSCSPSAVSFTNSSGQTALYVFHQGSGVNGQLWYNVLNSSGDWAGDRQIPSVSMSASPCAVVNNGVLYVLYEGGGQDKQFWYVASEDGNTWSTPIQVAEIGLSNAPSLVAFNDQLCCMMQGPSADGQLWYAVVNPGGTWGLMTHVNNVNLSYWPGTVVFNAQLYCFMQGASNNGNLYYTVFNGTDWSPQAQAGGSAIMSNAPSPVVFNGSLYAFFQGPGSNGALLYIQSQNGSSWPSSATTVPQAGMSYSPSAVAFDGQLFVFYNAKSEKNQLWYSVLSADNEWSGSMEVPGTDVLACSPSAVVFNDQLYVFYLNASYAVCCMQYQGNNSWGSSTTLPNASSGYGTGYFTAVVYNNGSSNELAVYFQGPSNDGSLYYITTTDPSSGWSAVSQAGAAPSTAGTSPQGSVSDLADYTIAALKGVVTGDA